MSNLQLIRTVWEVRYAPCGVLFDNRGRIADQWYKKDGFTNWSIARNQVLLHDDTQELVFQVDHRRLMVSVEGKYLAGHQELSSRASGSIISMLSIRKLTRIGYRIFLVCPVDDFDVPFRAMKNQLFSLSESEWALFGGEVIDVAFPITLQIGDYKANFKTGPMRKKEYDGLLQSDVTKQAVPDASILIDFDMFADNPRIKKQSPRAVFRHFIETAENQMMEIAEDLMKHYLDFAI